MGSSDSLTRNVFLTTPLKTHEGYKNDLCQVSAQAKIAALNIAGIGCEILPVITCSYFVLLSLSNNRKIIRGMKCVMPHFTEHIIKVKSHGLAPRNFTKAVFPEHA